MKDETASTYNGWTNWATWGVHLLITNESWECTLNAAQAAQQDARGEALQEWFCDVFLSNPQDGEYCYGNIAIQQLVEGTLSDVNWGEIKEALLAAYSAELEQDEDE